ncbi:ISAzo13-like element transposase-related protein [Leptothermofonsia sp. ETS-13]|uniref:ISAzo13-like element transposase-related protein n=1 Tax=Leptothermofonsia sp. ETS-13 TaxID=3035696 RepID=UPI003BA274E6
MEHRLFCHITPQLARTTLDRFIDLETVIDWTSNTMTQAGLEVHAQLDDNHYPTGIEVTDKQFDAIVIERCQFHGE